MHEQNLSDEFRRGILKRKPRLFLLQFRPFHNKVIRAERFNFEIAKKPIGIRSSRDRDLVGLSFEIIRGYIDIVNQGLK